MDILHSATANLSLDAQQASSMSSVDADGAADAHKDCGSGVTAELLTAKIQENLETQHVDVLDLSGAVLAGFDGGR